MRRDRGGAARGARGRRPLVGPTAIPWHARDRPRALVAGRARASRRVLRLPRVCAASGRDRHRCRGGAALDAGEVTRAGVSGLAAACGRGTSTISGARSCLQMVGSGSGTAPSVCCSHDSPLDCMRSHGLVGITTGPCTCVRESPLCYARSHWTRRPLVHIHSRRLALPGQDNKCTITLGRVDLYWSVDRARSAKACYTHLQLHDATCYWVRKQCSVG